MNFATIRSRLNALGVPHEHHQFKDTEKNPAPDPPFILWFYTETARGPDHAPGLLMEIAGAVELYTDDPDGALESRLESLVLHDMPYKKLQAVLDRENMVQTAYEFSFLEKRRVTHE